ncbi:MAG: dTDP-4-dehydrorhamnose 3,5-epimerase [Patescibacteria group bacterium]|nr:dTDP-4-dehydrorhamnose 3,5-epimerase [Patescibacteria group bacterium]
MQTRTFDIAGLVLMTPEVFVDERGYFFECFQKERYRELGIPVDDFVQENISKSKKGVLRGMHFQRDPFAQGKLVQVLCGRVLDVAVDIRFGSPTYGRYVTVELSEENHQQFWVPAGFAHGFLALEDDTIFSYKVTALYSKVSEGGIRFDDPDLNIAWPFKYPIVLEKDRQLFSLAQYGGNPAFRHEGK